MKFNTLKIQFTAAQAAQKTRSSIASQTLQFTAAQAAQKKRMTL